MVKTCIYAILLDICFSFACGVKCRIKIESNETILVCCADYEKKGNACIACSKGFTSNIGQKCRPCLNKTYGERCSNDCSCSAFEKCDVVDGCVDISVRETSGLLDKSTIGTSLDKSAQGPLSREIVVYYTISLIGAVFGICVCFVFYKCKTVSKRKKTTIHRSKNQSLPQSSQNVAKEELVYNIIVDEDMLDDEDILKMQIEMSPDFFDTKK